MKLTVPRSALLSALSACCAVVSSNPTVTAYGCILIETIDGTVRLRTTNGYQAIAVSVSTSAVERDGVAFVAAFDLLKQVTNMPDGDLVIAVKASALGCKLGKSARFSLSLLDSTLAPAMAQLEATGKPVAASALAALLDRAAPFADQDQKHVRPHIHAVRLLGNGARLSALATDGHYTACCASIAWAGKIDALVPLPAVTAIRKILSKEKGDVRQSVSGSSFVIRGESITFSSLLTEAVHPPIDQITPKAEVVGVRVGRLAMAAAIKAVVAIGPAGNKARIRPTGDGFTLSGVSATGDVAARSVPATCSLSAFPCNAEFLDKAVDFFDGDEVVMYAKEPGARGPGDSLGILRVGEDGSDDFALVMPLNYDAVDLAPSASEQEEEAA